MTDIKRIATKDAAAPAAAYSQAVQIPGLIYVSGQIPALPSGEIVKGSMTDRTRQCITSVKAILEAAGSSLDKAVRVGVFLTDMENFKDMNAEYAKWFGETKPARTCVAVKQLPLGVDIEIECIAVP